MKYWSGTDDIDELCVLQRMQIIHPIAFSNPNIRKQDVKSKPLYVEKESFDSEYSIIQETQSLYENGLNNTETTDLIIQKYGLKKEEQLRKTIW